MIQADGLAVMLGWSWWQFVEHNWALLSIFCTLAALIAIPSVVLGRYIRIMLNLVKDTPPPLGMGPFDFERIEGQVVRFRAFDGTSLRGMFLFGDPTERRKGMILFCHEFAYDMYSSARYCRPLLKAGFDVFMFDFRGHGESSCADNYRPMQWASDHEVDDVLGACAFVKDYLESQGLPAELGVFGISRGAGAAVLACANNPAINAILTDGLFCTDLTVEAFMKRWAYIFAKVRFVYEHHPLAFWRFLRWLLFKFTPRALNCRFPSIRKALARNAGKPMFMIHGQRDSYIPVQQAQKLFDLAGEPKSLWIVPGARHNQPVAVAPEQYAVRTVQFFEQYLAPEGGAQQHPVWDRPGRLAVNN